MGRRGRSNLLLTPYDCPWTHRLFAWRRAAAFPEFLRTGCQDADRLAAKSSFRDPQPEKQAK